MYVYIWALACTHWAEQEINEKQTKQEKNITGTLIVSKFSNNAKALDKKKIRKNQNVKFYKNSKSRRHLLK